LCAIEQRSGLEKSERWCGARGSPLWKALVFIKKAWSSLSGVAPGAVVRDLVCCCGPGRKERVAGTFYGFMPLSEREHSVKAA
jgi:hypothetical protein